MKLTTLKNWEKKKKPALPEETSKPKLLVTDNVYSEAKQGSHNSCLINPLLPQTCWRYH